MLLGKAVELEIFTALVCIPLKKGYNKHANITTIHGN